MAVGLGDKNATMNVYIENSPEVEFLKGINSVVPLSKEKISNIVAETGNHWRKIFNVYAKLIHENQPSNGKTWQHYRDTKLLTMDSGYALLFTPPKMEQLSTHSISTPDAINIVMGKTYAIKLGLAEQFDWISPFFAINTRTKSIICPYFDYRQLSNIKIKQLSQLIDNLR